MLLCLRCGGKLKNLPYRQVGSNFLSNNAIYYQCCNCQTQYVLPNAAAKSLIGDSSSIAELLILPLLALFISEDISRWLNISEHWVKISLATMIVIGIIVLIIFYRKEIIEKQTKILSNILVLNDVTLAKYPELAYKDISLTWTTNDFFRLNHFDKMLVSIIMILFGFIIIVSFFR